MGRFAGRTPLTQGATVLGSAFFSPQFLLWFLPLLPFVSVRPAWAWVATVVALDVVTYLWFPLVFDATGPLGVWSQIVALVRVALYAGVLTVLVRSTLLNRFLEPRSIRA